jgi:hypothetical protein
MTRSSESHTSRQSKKSKQIKPNQQNKKTHKKALRQTEQTNKQKPKQQTQQTHVVEQKELFRLDKVGHVTLIIDPTSEEPSTSTLARHPRDDGSPRLSRLYVPACAKSVVFGVQKALSLA